MDGFLKDLLGTFEKSDSRTIHIVDDNFESSLSSSLHYESSLSSSRHFDSSLSSITEHGTSGYRKQRVRRSISENSSFTVLSDNDGVYDYRVDRIDSSRLSDGQLHYKKNHSNKNYKNKQLSARMERHKQTRWDASPSSSFSSIVSPVTRIRNTTRRHSNDSDTRDRLIGAPNLVMDQSPRLGVIEDSDDGEDYDDYDPTYEIDMSSRSQDAFDISGRSSDTLDISGRSHTDSVVLAHQSVIDKALAISKRRVDSKTAPPPRPTRRCSIDDVPVNLLLPEQVDPPPLPTRKSSIDDVPVNLLLPEQVDPPPLPTRKSSIESLQRMFFIDSIEESDDDECSFSNCLDEPPSLLPQRSYSTEENDDDECRSFLPSEPMDPPHIPKRRCSVESDTCLRLSNILLKDRDLSSSSFEVPNFLRELPYQRCSHSV